MEESLLKKTDLDDVLTKFSILGRYHRVAVLLLAWSYTLNVIYCFNFVFVVKDVGYQCVNITTYHNKADISENLYNHNCKSDIPCAKWVYDDPNSFVAEFDLACQEWKKTLVGSAYAFGYMLGILIVGTISDRFGRKIALVLTGLLAGVFGLTRSFTNQYWIFILTEFLEGAIGDSHSPAFTLMIELVSTKSRPTSVALCNIGYALGGISFALIAWLVPYWRTMLQILYTPGLLYIFYIYLIDESPRWLLVNGKKDKAMTMIRKAAKLNKVELKDNLELRYEEQRSVKFVSALAETFKSKTLLKRFFVCATWWLACTFVNQGMIINTVSLQGNKYINYALAAIMKLPSQILVVVMLKKYNRKLTLIGCFLICALLCFARPFVPQDIMWLVIIIYMGGKILSSSFFTITYIFTSELFPTCTRSTMQAMCSSLGCIGFILAPQTPLLATYWSGLSAVVFGTVALLAGLATFLVPDTTDASLPDTVQQAEVLEDKKRDEY